MLHHIYKGNLKQHKTIHGHNTLSKFNFHVQFCNTVLSQRSTVNMRIKQFFYNKVPGSINNGITINSLKKNYNPYY